MLFNPAPQCGGVDVETFRRFSSCVTLIQCQADGIQLELLRVFLPRSHFVISSCVFYPLTGLCRSIRPPHLALAAICIP